MKQLLLLVVLACVLAGCGNGPLDPLGATSRTKLRIDASVSVAQSDAQARIAAAQADERARIAQAQADQTARIAEAQAREAAIIAQANANVITEQTRQQGATARAMAWATVLPIVLLIVGATLVLALVVNWQGRIWYARTVQAGAQAHTLTADQRQLLRDYAAQTGQRVLVQDGQYYLTDGQCTVQARLKG